MTTVEHEREPASATDSVALFARRAKRITQADVFTAADLLLIEGDRPTIDRVRMKLGRGSPNTINEHLDAWWGKLGARLRDLPGREFPQLPERVAGVLQQLWTTALECAHELLQTTLTEREGALVAAEARQVQAAQALAAHTEAVNARAAGLEESLEVLRTQLAAAIERTRTLEVDLRDRDALLGQGRAHAQALEQAAAQLRAQLTAIESAHRDERVRWQEQHAATEAHWLQETDRARQAHKDSEREGKALVARVRELATERDQARLELTEARGALRAFERVRAEQRATPIRSRVPVKKKKSVRKRARGADKPAR